MSVLKCSIAIVEDDASFRRAAERLLRASGFEAHTFASAEEFLKSAVHVQATPLRLRDLHRQFPGSTSLGLRHLLRRGNSFVHSRNRRCGLFPACASSCNLPQGTIPKWSTDVRRWA